MGIQGWRRGRGVDDFGYTNIESGQGKVSRNDLFIYVIFILE
jgi:hypothetical protein